MLRLIKRNERAVACERCGIELTDPESIARGMGEECAMTQAAQFSAISNLWLALSTGHFDMVARKHFILKSIVETKLADAKSERNPRQIVRFTKELKRINGILVSRELQRQARAERMVA